MKIFSTLLLIALLGIATSFALTPANVGGNWTILVDAGGQQVAVDLAITQKDDTFTGTTSSDLGDGTLSDGKVTNSEFTAIMKTSLQGQPVEIKLSGKVDGDKMTGNMDVPGFGVLPFSGAKKK